MDSPTSNHRSGEVMAQKVQLFINLEDEKIRFGRFNFTEGQEGSDWENPISVDVDIRDDEVNSTPVIDLDFYGDVVVVDDFVVDDFVVDDDVVILEDPKKCKKTAISHSRSESRKRNIRKLSLSPLTIIEIGESSNQKRPPSEQQPPAFCTICFEPKSASETFTMMTGCSHTYCSDCIKQYVAAKIQENTTKIGCPDPECKVGLLEPENCHAILPQVVFERWCATLCESLLFDSSAFYCPFKDCSAPLLNEDTDSLHLITESECPHCLRLFCANCKVPWHTGFTCEDFQKLGANERSQEDITLMNMAKDKKWQRCPKCKIFVERIEGCMFMKCRCRYTFCYGCGTEMTVDHYCRECKR